MLEGRKIIRRCYQAANQSAISQYLLQQAGGSERLLVLWQVLKVAHTHTHTHRDQSASFHSAHSQDQLPAEVSW